MERRMYIKRDKYLERIAKRGENGMGKVITGILRAGKSFLLLTIYRQYLLSQGVSADHIIAIALDDIKFKELRDSEKLCHYIAFLVSDKEGMFYGFLLEKNVLDL